MPTSVDIQGIAFQVTDVADVTISEPTQDDEGYYARDIHIYGEPAEEGGVLPIVAIIRIRALQSEGIDVTAPEQEF